MPDGEAGPATLKALGIKLPLILPLTLNFELKEMAMKKLTVLWFFCLFTFAFCLASYAGQWTAHGYFYKPSMGASGQTEYNLFNQGLDQADAELFALDPPPGLVATPPLTYNSATGVLALPQASARASGYLASGDWSAFNAKEPAISLGTSLQYWRGDKTWQILNPAAVGAAPATAGTSILKGNGSGGTTAAVSNTDYAAVRDNGDPTYVWNGNKLLSRISDIWAGITGNLIVWGNNIYGTNLATVISTLGSTPAHLVVPTGSFTVSSSVTIPANITTEIKHGALFNITIPDVTIQGLSRASACVVTWAGHGLSTGNKVSIRNITQGSWKYLNGGIFPITKIDANSFSIPVDTSNTSVFPAYTPDSNGLVSQVLDIRGTIEAGAYQIFNAMPGKVAIAQGALRPDWWGAVAGMQPAENYPDTPPSGTVDSSPALQAMFYALPLDSAGRFQFSNGAYYLHSNIDLRSIVTTNNYVQCTIKLIGDNTVFYTDQPIIMMSRTPPNQYLANALASASYVVDGITWRGSGYWVPAPRGQIGLDLQCTYNSKISDCRFTDLGIGLRLLYDMMPEVSNCIAGNCSVVSYDVGDGGDYWPGAALGWPTNTGVFRSCRSYNYGAVLSNIAGLSSANPCVVTWTNHGLSNDDIIFIQGITQGSSTTWQSLNKRRFKVSAASTNTFTLTKMDGVTTFDTSTWPTYTPDSNGQYCAWNGGWRFRNAYMNIDSTCISEGANPVDDIMVDTLSTGAAANFSIPLSHIEDTPIGSNLYLRYSSGKIEWAAGSVDAYDSTGMIGTIILNGWNGATLRNPGDTGGSGSGNSVSWVFKYGGATSAGSDPTNPSYWYKGNVGPHIVNYQNGESNITAQKLAYSTAGGVQFTSNANLANTFGWYPGVRAESIYDTNYAQDSGGIGCHDNHDSTGTIIQNQLQPASMMHLKAGTGNPPMPISITSTGATQELVGFIPAGAEVLGFTAYVSSAIGGATSLSIGTDASPNLWINAMGVTSGSQGGLANATATGPAIYPASANVRLTANGGSFNGTGAVRIVCHYIALEPPLN